MSEFLAAALAYAALGCKVFPVHGVVEGRCTCGKGPDAHLKGKKPGKHPATPDRSRPNGLKIATSDPVLIRTWWAINPNWNVAIATGEGSGFWVLDVDGADGASALDALEVVNGPLPATVEQRTGGGRHVCFRYDPEGREVRNRARVGKVPIDVRGNGGYIVAPPSVHMTGRRYAWADGCAPGETDFADAPAWLRELVAPAPVAVAPAASLTPRRREGRASAYGEKALDNAGVKIHGAQVGSRDSTLFEVCCSIGRLVAGGEIERAYAEGTLASAGRVHVPDAMTEAQLVRQVARGLDKGAEQPKSAPERTGFQSAVAPRPKPSVAEQALDIRDARALWKSAESADCGAFRTWLTGRGLEPYSPKGAIGRLRAHRTAPLGRGRDGREKVGPAMLAPLVRDPEAFEWGEGVDALAVLPLFEGAERFTAFVGDPTGKVCPLVVWPARGEVLVTLDLQDAWALGANACENGHALGVAIAPMLRTFAGAPLGDRWGRIDPLTPYADPQQPPWTHPSVGDVFLAVRGDLRTPALKYRKLWGSTGEVAFSDEQAARFYGGMAEQAWRAAGANGVRILKPSGGAGFNSWRERGAA